MESEVTLADVLMFWTGAEAIPPGGFPLRPTLAFYSQDQGNRLPSSSTCGLYLWVPRGCSGVDDFLKMMTFVLKNTYGFGKL